MPRAFKAKVRRVVTSLGVLVPKELSEKEHIKEGDEIELGILRKNDLKEIERVFGIAKGAKPFERDRTDRW